MNCKLQFLVNESVVLLLEHIIFCDCSDKCRCFEFLVVDIMGKPARWLKSVLLGKKPSKSSGSKDKEVTFFVSL